MTIRFECDAPGCTASVETSRLPKGWKVAIERYGRGLYRMKHYCGCDQKKHLVPREVRARVVKQPDSKGQLAMFTEQKK